MANHNTRENCFTYYGATSVCNACVAAKRCKAMLISHGFDIIGAILEEMTRDLPEDVSYNDSDRMSEICTQLLIPPVKAPILEDDLELILALELDKPRGLQDLVKF